MIVALVVAGWSVLLAPVSFVAVAACRSGRRDDLAHGRSGSGAAHPVDVRDGRTALVGAH